MLPETERNGAEVAANRLLKRINELHISHITSKISSHVTINMGISMIAPNLDSNPQELVRKADEALYLAKKQGRNRYEVII